MAAEPELRAHQEWLGFVQPVGLVVSPAALLATQTYVQRNIVPQQQILQGLVRQEKIAIGPEGEKEERPVLPDLPEFCIQFLGWRNTDIVGLDGTAQIPDTLKVALADYGETLAPTYAVPDSEQNDGWVLLIQTLKRGTDLDLAIKQDDRHWHATPQARFERLLRETKVPIGMLFNHTEIRLVYAPSGESAGYLTFPIKAMCEVAGRPIAAALHMLLSTERLFTVETTRRLPAILRESRKYQNEVSTALAAQVLAALNELLRGFQAANEASKNVLLAEVLASDPNQVYGGLLTSLMRLVFILYAEDRGLLPSDSVYVNSYSVEGLFERLREDAARYPDNMDGRYGAWAQLLTLFRLIYDGANHGAMRLPARHGKLFDPDAYPFLEGRPYRSQRVLGERLKLPRLSDGVIYRVLTNLLLLKGEQLSYRALDVEQIGSVYEAMMGYELQIATGSSIGLKPDNVVTNLEKLLRITPADRPKELRDETGCELSGQALEQLKSAKTVDELLAALSKKASRLTPNLLPSGSMFLQPTDERRRSGSDYTPRSLTEPIVRTTLRPIFEQLGEHPRPEQILDLKICDPAMGSGAFLVEACRFLGDMLVEAWNYYRELPTIPPDEDPSLLARRVIAQRCLYGVDINPFATDLAKLSLWLVTLAKDHPFTFLDHSLRCGDSLVGFDRIQIGQFHWDTTRSHSRVFGQEHLERAIERVTRYRREILEMVEDNVASILIKQERLGLADQALDSIRRAGDLLAIPIFEELKDKTQERRRVEYRDLYLSASQGNLADLSKETQVVDRFRNGKAGVKPFHWEIEFPEVFLRARPGFDAIVGNPPFMGGTRISSSLGKSYLRFLSTLYEGSGNRMDLVAYFFRRGFTLLRNNGTSGLIATKTIAQGDTRAGGLRWICNNGGTIFCARRRLRWPGAAAVIVAVVHFYKGVLSPPFVLDEKEVPVITAFLFYAGGNDDPLRLAQNVGKCSIGSYVFGSGFTFDDDISDANPLSVMQELIGRDRRNQERIFPYIGGEELSESPTLGHSRFVIDFGQMSEVEARRWPDLYQLLKTKVQPYRLSQAKEVAQWPWWQFWRVRSELYGAIDGLPRVLALCRHSNVLAFAFLPPKMVYADSLAVFALSEYSSFGLLQSRVHEVWARFFGSSIKDDLRYTPSDCFETFPLPALVESRLELEGTGDKYYQFRASLMARNNEGLTKTYHRFHDPDDFNPDITKLRDLHAEMDRAVLRAYGWRDIEPKWEFLLDYEDEENGETKQRRRRKPWRYRWPDEIRDEVLARLLELNRVRAEEEQLSGAAAEANSTSMATRHPGKGKKNMTIGSRSLLDSLPEEGQS